MATRSGGRGKPKAGAADRRKAPQEQDGAFDLGAPASGWMPKHKILELVKQIDASLKENEPDKRDADV